MADLVEWLTSVWDEDERREHARRDFGKGGQPRGVLHRPERVEVLWPSGYREDLTAAEFEERYGAGDKRALARIAADRKILELHTGDHNCREIVTGTYPADWPEGVSWGKPGASWRHVTDEYYDEGEHCPTARLLAEAHADRAGFRDEWRV